MEIYRKERCEVVLVLGAHNGIRYKIITRGSHPCAYILLPKDSEIKNVSSDDINLNVHCGLTYKDEEGWIGWDYAHLGDYIAYMEELDGKKWTVEEIEKHCIEAIEELLKLNKFKKKEKYYFSVERVDWMEES